MPTITKEKKVQTVISTFDTTPGTCQDLLDALLDAYTACISRQPGFIGAGLHVNDAQTRVANYSQWDRREDYQAMLRLPEMRNELGITPEEEQQINFQLGLNPDGTLPEQKK